jgi:peptide/nickel transport system ATP-binding protein
MSEIEALKERLGFAIIFVTHDMSAVSEYSDRVMVMYAGEIVEVASTEVIFDRPMHPYTRGLMDAFPSLHGPRRELSGIPGTPPDLRSLPPGCPFEPRCSEAFADCPTHHPDLYSIGRTEARCLLYAGSQKEAVS